MTNATIKETVYTTYAEAINWLNPNLIRVNNICEVDPSCYNNMRFNDYNEENDSYMEIYQYYLTNLNESDVEWLEKHFDNILFTYSDLLDCYVLCVNHLGTSWNYVHCEVIDEEFAEQVKRQGKTYKDLTGQDF